MRTDSLWFRFTLVMLAVTVFGLSPAGSAFANQHFTRFTEYETGLRPSDWTVRSGSNAAWKVVDANYLRLDHNPGGTTTRYALTWNKISASQHQEMLVLARSNNGSNISLGLRMSSWNPEGYIGQITADNIRILKQSSGGSTTVMASNASYTAQNGKWYWLRFRVQGNALKLRVWEKNTPEPTAWHLEATDSMALANGLVGFSYTTAQPINVDYDIVIVALGGATAVLTTPHGSYDFISGACASCHVAHAGQGTRLLDRSEITTLCFVCHDGTGSTMNVAAVFGGGSGNTGYHPVRSTGNPAINPELIECVDCHNPHADNARLLCSTDGTNTFTRNPDFCLSCHGDTVRTFTGDDPANDYWKRTLGSHVNANNPAHYQTIGRLLPTTGTRVTCTVCHAKHAAPRDRLLGVVEENLCQGCHLTGSNLSGEGHRTQYFNRTGSVHDVSRTGAAVLGCTSCHGPHTVNAVQNLESPVNQPNPTPCRQCHWPGSANFNEYLLYGAKSVISDPYNTKALFAGAPGTGLADAANSVGDLTDFCLRCHSGNPPTATATVETFVPYTIAFPGTSFTNSSSGWHKESYKTTAHGLASVEMISGYPGRPITCGTCHESHGSNFRTLLRFGKDYDRDWTGSPIPLVKQRCLRCHDGSKAKNVANDFHNKAYRHPALEYFNKHRNTENYDHMPLADRHAECVDCHDPHQATSTGGSAPAARGPSAGVSGVSINWGTSSWSDWPGNASFTFRLGIAFQYELCFKCHSRYSYGANPPDSVSRGGGTKQVDIAQAVNPSNASYHPVVGSTKVGTFTHSGTTYVFGYLNPSWLGATTWVTFSGGTQQPAAGRISARLYCTDCHGSNTSDLAGPHGSAHSFILTKLWSPGTTGNSGTGTHLCFHCHDFNFYASGSDAGANTRRSGFSWAAQNYWNIHSVTHQGNQPHSNIPCATCHGAAPHGWNRRSILVQNNDPQPFRLGSTLTLRQAIPTRGSWDCTICHNITSPGCSPCH